MKKKSSNAGFVIRKEKSMKKILMSLFVVLILTGCSRDFNPWSTVAQEIIKNTLKDNDKKK